MTVTIGNTNLNTAYDLSWYDLSLGAPDARVQYTSILGRHGDIDLTEAGGNPIKYQNRTLKLRFYQDQRNQAQWAALCTKLFTAFHGKREKIILDSDPNFFYLGRISMQIVKSSLITSLIDITVTCDPWKYKTTQTTATVTPTAGGTLKVLENLFAPACPTFTTAQSGIEVKQGTRRVTLLPGGYKIPELVLQAGSNPLTFYGAGAVTITWQEGTL